MDDPGVLHRIEDDLSETWLEEFAADGVQALEAYLAKHLAFQAFLENVMSGDPPVGRYDYARKLMPLHAAVASATAAEPSGATSPKRRFR